MKLIRDIREGLPYRPHLLKQNLWIFIY